MLMTNVSNYLQIAFEILLRENEKHASYNFIIQRNKCDFNLRFLSPFFCYFSFKIRVKTYPT